MRRLCATTLEQLPPVVTRPAPGRERRISGIVHLGLGAFARAHLAAYTEDVLALEDGPWGIAGISLKRPDQRDRLAPQDGLYTLVTRAPDGPQHRVLGAVNGCLVLPENPQAVLAQMTRPATRIVSLTVTEKGYCHDPATGRLNAGHPDIRHDLDHRDAPRSAIGLIVAALAARHGAGLAPFTVLCCDNLPSNGRVLRQLVLDFARLRDDALASWIEVNGAFPCTMVDRIVPATTDADRTGVEAALGLHDAAPVIAEPFRQWAIEDHFAAGRPAWERVGAEFVGDVAAHELMKLRLLNGAHSSLAYLGYLAGHETVASASADPFLAGFLEGLWREIIPTVPPPPGVDLQAYVAALLQRFRNPAMAHRTWQIAMDGSQKLPQRLLDTVRDRLEAGAALDHLALGIAGWMAYVAGMDGQGRAIDVRDPLAAEFARIAQASGRQAVPLAQGLLGLNQIFGPDLPRSEILRHAVIAHLEVVLAQGAMAAIRRLSATTP